MAEKKVMELRGKEFSIDGNRFVSANRDIVHLGYPLMLGTMEAVGELYPDQFAELTHKGAPALSALCNEALLSEAKTPGIMASFREKLSAMTPQAELAMTRELAMAFLTLFVAGCRETMTHPFMSDDEMRRTATVSLIMSALPEDLRKTLRRELQLAMSMPAALERPNPPGKWEGRPNAGQG